MHYLPADVLQRLSLSRDSVRGALSLQGPGMREVVLVVAGERLHALLRESTMAEFELLTLIGSPRVENDGGFRSKVLIPRAGSDLTVEASSSDVTELHKLLALVSSGAAGVTPPSVSALQAPAPLGARELTDEDTEDEDTEDEDTEDEDTEDEDTEDEDTEDEDTEILKNATAAALGKAEFDEALRLIDQFLGSNPPWDEPLRYQLLRDCVAEAVKDPEHGLHLAIALDHCGYLPYLSKDLCKGLAHLFSQRRQPLSGALAVEVAPGKAYEKQVTALLASTGMTFKEFEGVRKVRTLEYLEQRAQSAPSQLTYWALAEQLQDMGRPEEAIAMAERLVAQYPESPGAWLCLAQLHDSVEQKDAQIKTLKAAFERFPDDLVVRNALAEAFEFAHQPEAAIPHYIPVFEATQDEGVLSNLCDVLREAKDPRLAVYLKHTYDLANDSDERQSLAEELATLGAAIVPTTPPLGTGSQVVPTGSDTTRPSIRNNILWLVGTSALLFLPLGPVSSVVPALIGVQVIWLIIKTTRRRA